MYGNICSLLFNRKSFQHHVLVLDLDFVRIRSSFARQKQLCLHALKVTAKKSCYVDCVYIKMGQYLLT